MKKNVLLLLLLAMYSAAYAQQTSLLGAEDMQQAFEQYNPGALQQAEQDAAYKEILTQLTTAYAVPRTEENELELIALVKNFDNSVTMYALRQFYTQQRTLQAMTGTQLEALTEQMQRMMEPVVQRIFDNTLEVKKIQIKRYQMQIKEIKKDKNLTASDKKTRIEQLKQRIKEVKQEIRLLKADAKQTIKNSAAVYVGDIEATYEASLKKDAAAAQSASRDVKANHKKPVAE